MSTAERVSHIDPSDNFVFARSLLAYREAAERIGGKVLEIGAGGGYGAGVLSPVVDSLISVDKCESAREPIEAYPNVSFRRMKVPPLDFPSCTFDCVVSFQVIEHIKDDFAFIAEIYRVLKPGGKFIVTTPNSQMSLTRNPWHVREYTLEEFYGLMERRFEAVEALGIFGNGNVMEYYEHNREGVARIARFDPLKLRDRLPRRLLRIPYDVANRLNRRRLMAENEDLTRAITPDDYRLAPVAEGAFDLFYIGTKL